jgi:hypothetical protein
MSKLILHQFYSTRGDILTLCMPNVHPMDQCFNTSNDDIKTCMNIYRLTQPPILTCKVFYTMDVLRIHTATTP